MGSKPSRPKSEEMSQEHSLEDSPRFTYYGYIAKVSAGQPAVIDLRLQNLTALPSSLFKSGVANTLVELTISSNGLTSLPESVGNLRSLTKLDASNNKLEYLPSEIGKLVLLDDLNLNNNRLVRLPDELCKLSNLTALRLCNNKLTSLPRHFFKLKQLCYVNVNNNDLDTSTLPVNVLNGGLYINQATPSFILPRLYLGGDYSAGQKDALKKIGISHILVVGKELFAHHPSDFMYMSIAVADEEQEDLYSHLLSCIAFIDEGRKNGTGVLVHCRQGISRSAAVVVAYCMVEKKLTTTQALSIVKQSRPCVAPNSGFLQQLKQFGKTRRQLKQDSNTSNNTNNTTSNTSNSSTTAAIAGDSILEQQQGDLKDSTTTIS